MTWNYLNSKVKSKIHLGWYHRGLGCSWQLAISQLSESLCLQPAAPHVQPPARPTAETHYLVFPVTAQEPSSAIYLPSNEKQRWNDLSTHKLTSWNCCSLHRTARDLSKICDLQLYCSNTGLKVKQEDAFFFISLCSREVLCCGPDKSLLFLPLYQHTGRHLSFSVRVYSLREGGRYRSFLRQWVEPRLWSSCWDAPIQPHCLPRQRLRVSQCTQHTVQ